MNGFRLWHFAQASLGIVQWVGIAILLNPIIIERTSSGALLGQVMALIGGAGLLAPLIGGIADKYACHRIIQRMALFIHIIALLILYFAETTMPIYWTVGILIGIGSVSLLVLNPTFVLASSQNQEQEGRGLTSLFQCQFFGIIVTGVLVAIAESLNVSSDNQLLILLALVVCVLIVVSIAPPPSVNVSEMEVETDTNESRIPDTPKKYLPWFLFLLAVFFSMFLSSNLMELGPLLIKEVYQVEIGNSALGMAASAFISIFMLESAGRWMQKSGPFNVWFTAQIVYLLIGSLFWVTAGKDVHSLIPIALLVVLMQAMSWNDMIIPAIAGRLSPASPALTQGLLMLCMAGGFGVGAMLAGMSIDQFGYASVFTLSLFGIVVALSCIVLLTLTSKTSVMKTSVAQ
ncbi:MFS transporter [Vibrio methylphosphonaticus]|uniref:MFS transporter n=1 Tax=Vibrio methylphosphonaticus TaxID=2946866 RepID=UPI00202A6A3F|nr:MFS transporter [Vibrio methylphosphonaticus]MCL9774864.1 MFS transporter [Vibrio methylphosphonaticus]